jgi:O-antigen ligase
VLAAAALIWFLRRSGGRVILISATVIAVLFGGYLVARPDNFSEFAARIAGIFSAVETPPGTEDCDEFDTNAECVDAGRVEKREIRMLFYQQGARLLAERPILGYGVGQFGGIVAEKHDPNWELDPRFPGGFNLYDFDGTTVDSFWLHLVVETGVLGLLAYLTWLWLLAVPLLGVSRRFAGRRVWGAGPRLRPNEGAGHPRDPADGRAAAAALWGVGVVVFGVIIGFFAPALEDALYPLLAFAIIGVAWVLNGVDRRNLAGRATSPATTAQGDL